MGQQLPVASKPDPKIASVLPRDVTVAPGFWFVVAWVAMKALYGIWSSGDSASAIIALIGIGFTIAVAWFAVWRFRPARENSHVRTELPQQMATILEAPAAAPPAETLLAQDAEPEPAPAVVEALYRVGVLGSIDRCQPVSALPLPTPAAVEASASSEPAPIPTDPTLEPAPGSPEYEARVEALMRALRNSLAPSFRRQHIRLVWPPEPKEPSESS